MSTGFTLRLAIFMRDAKRHLGCRVIIAAHACSVMALPHTITTLAKFSHILSRISVCLVLLNYIYKTLSETCVFGQISRFQNFTCLDKPSCSTIKATSLGSHLVFHVFLLANDA
jgi:hypothetical protein